MSNNNKKIINQLNKQNKEAMAQNAMLAARPMVPMMISGGGGSFSDYNSQLKGTDPEDQAIIDAGGTGLSADEMAKMTNLGDESISNDTNDAINRTRESANARGILQSGLQTGTETELNKAGVADKATNKTNIGLYNNQVKRQSLADAFGRRQQLTGQAAGLYGQGMDNNLRASSLNASNAFAAQQSALQRAFQNQQGIYDRLYQARLQGSQNPFLAGLGSAATSLGSAALIGKPWLA